MVLCLPSMRMVVGIGIVDMLGGGVEAEVVVSVAVEEVGITALRLMLSRIWEATIKSLHFKAAVMFHLIASYIHQTFFLIESHYFVVPFSCFIYIFIRNNYNTVSLVWAEWTMYSWFYAGNGCLMGFPFFCHLLTPWAQPDGVPNISRNEKIIK